MAEVAVRDLGCSGFETGSGILAGLDWVAVTLLGPAVVDMSIGGSLSGAFRLGTRNLFPLGVVGATSDASSSADVCDYSAARVGEALTVDATASNEIRALYSHPV